MDGYVTIGTELDTKSFDKEIREVKEKLDDIEQTLKMASDDKTLFSTREIKEMELEAEKLRNKLISLNERQSKLAEKPPSNVTEWLKGIGKETDKTIKKVSKWALAIFGIRSAYNFLRQSISTISQYDQQVATDIEYIRVALASTLEPVVKRIIALVYQLLGYLGYIVKAWTGRNIFENANKGLKQAVGSAKELKKQLLPIDEMNILSDSSSGGGASGGATPSFDLSNPDNIEPPEWLTWIVEHKNEILSTLAGIATSLGLIHLGLDPIKSSGIGLTVAGITYSVSELLEYLKDPTFEHFGGTIEGIGGALGGLAITIGSLTLGVAGAVVLIFGLIIKYWDKIKAFLEEKIAWLEDKGDWIREHFGNIVGNIYDNIVQNLRDIVDRMDISIESIKGQFDGLIMFIQGVFTGDWNKAWEGIKLGFESWAKGIKEIANSLINSVKNQVITMASIVANIIGSIFKGVINAVLKAIEYQLNQPINAINSLLGVINKVPGISLERISTIKLPRLEKGGIINMPGRGVNYGGANIAERQPEGVIPLSNSQQMQLLGEAIGKYITVNNVNPIYLNGRQIGKEINTSNAERDFAFNR